MFSEKTLTLALLFAGAAHAQVEDDSILTDASFMVQSDSKANWEEGNQLLTIIGFALFGCFYFYTVISVFVDMNLRSKKYTEDVENDIEEMKKLKIGPGSNAWDTIQKELRMKLAGEV